MKATFKTLSFLLVQLMLLGSFVPLLSFAQVASSTSYKMISDSTTNCGGGYSTSTNYRLFDTLCEQAISNSTSTSYSVQAGFQSQSDLPSLTVSYSTTTLAFGSITSGAVASASTQVTVTTNASNGYSISVLADGNFRKTTAETTTTASDEIIAQVTDGTVSTGGNEYGFSTSSTDLAIPTSTPAIVNSNTTWATSETTTITFKAGAGVNTSSGTYTQTITLIVTGTF